MHVDVGVDQDISALAAVASVRSAVDDELFPVEGCGSVSAVSGFGCDFYAVNKIAHGFPFCQVSFSWSVRVREFFLPLR